MITSNQIRYQIFCLSNPFLEITFESIRFQPRMVKLAIISTTGKSLKIKPKTTHSKAIHKKFSSPV